MAELDVLMQAFRAELVLSNAEQQQLRFQEAEALKTELREFVAQVEARFVAVAAAVGNFEARRSRGDRPRPVVDPQGPVAAARLTGHAAGALVGRRQCGQPAHRRPHALRHGRRRLALAGSRRLSATGLAAVQLRAGGLGLSVAVREARVAQLRIQG